MMATDKQRRMINGVVQALASYTGHDFDEIKTIAKRRAVKRGYPFVEAGDDIAPVSESVLSKLHASMLIDELLQLAAELGVFVRGERERDTDNSI